MANCTRSMSFTIVEISFPAGLPGFPNAHRFRMEPWGPAGSPFLLISSVERAEEIGLCWRNKQRQSETARPPHGGVPVPRNGKRHPRP